MHNCDWYEGVHQTDRNITHTCHTITILIISRTVTKQREGKSRIFKKKKKKKLWER